MDIGYTFWILSILFLLLITSLFIISRLYKNLSKERFRNRSQSTKYGQLTEQFMPLLDSYPWNPSGFKFLGNPIDGIQFENDRIVLVEFKTASSKLSKTQREIKNLVALLTIQFTPF
mgnify:FL=1